MHSSAAFVMTSAIDYDVVCETRDVTNTQNSKFLIKTFEKFNSCVHNCNISCFKGQTHLEIE